MATEQVFFRGHPSWRSMLGFHLKGLVLAVIAGAIAGVVTRIVAGHVQAGWVAVAVVAVFVLVLVRGASRRARITYTITSERLTIRLGVVSQDLHQARLERVQNVRARQSVLERILRVGTIEFDTAGGDDDFTFRGVANPRQIVQTVDRALREHRDDRTLTW